MHISYLPFNKGYYPNLWSHLDSTPSGVSIHEIDKGIDTGKILKKKWLKIENDWSLLRTYCEVLELASNELVNVIEATMCNLNRISDVKEDSKSSYNSWPDVDLNKQLRKNNRKYFHFADIAFLHNLVRS